MVDPNDIGGDTRTLHVTRWQVLLALDQNGELRFFLVFPGRIIRPREVPALEETFHRQLWPPTLPLSQRTFVGA